MNRLTMRKSARTIAGGLSLLLLFAGLGGAAETEVFGNRETKIYHKDFCPEKEKIKKRDLRILESETEADAKGYYPCPICISKAYEKSSPKNEIKKLALPLERQQQYVGDKTTKLFHHSWCQQLAGTPAEERRIFDSAKTAAQQGYQPCSECGPPAMYIRKTIETKPDDIKAIPTPVKPPENTGQKLTDQEMTP